MKHTNFLKKAILRDIGMRHHIIIIYKKVNFKAFRIIIFELK